MVYQKGADAPCAEYDYVVLHDLAMNKCGELVQCVGLRLEACLLKASFISGVLTNLPIAALSRQVDHVTRRKNELWNLKAILYI